MEESDHGWIEVAEIFWQIAYKFPETNFLTQIGSGNFHKKRAPGVLDKAGTEKVLEDMFGNIIRLKRTLKS